MAEVVMIVEGSERARVSLIEGDVEVQRESGDLCEVPAMVERVQG